jgi:soluble lytic murein transglycosylase-like protein
MPVRYIAAGFLVVALQPVAAAQKVDLLEFDAVPRADVVINVGPDRAQIDQGLDLAVALPADIAGNIPARPVASVPQAGSINVPGWMRSGVSPSTILLQGVSRSRTSGRSCGHRRYRPRGDLPAATELRRAQHFPLIAAIACKENIPVGLFDALIAQESRYQILAQSPKGAIGLAQLMPGTAQDLGVSDPWDVVQNLQGGARYLRMQIEEFGRYDLALAAYNSGPGRVRQARRIPQIPETLAYVRNIIAAWANGWRRDATHLPGPLPAATPVSFPKGFGANAIPPRVESPK